MIPLTPENTMEIRSLDSIDFDTLFRAFSRAFEDYELQLGKEQLRSMLKRRGFCPDLSFAAFDEDEIVSFTLNGIGTFKGVSTAYDTGTGTVKKHRGKGLATRIFEYSIPYLKEARISQYLLEVLQHNTKAVSVYKNIGFQVSREFHYFRQQNEEIKNEVKAVDGLFTWDEIKIENSAQVSSFWDFEPSWQNNFESIRRAPDDFICLGVFAGKNLVGYCVFEPASGDITQLAVDKQYRRMGIASLLLKEMLRINKNDSVKAINTEISCDSITGFFQAKNIKIRGQQFEMVKNI